MTSFECVLRFVRVTAFRCVESSASDVISSVIYCCYLSQKVMSRVCTQYVMYMSLFVRSSIVFILLSFVGDAIVKCS